MKYIEDIQRKEIADLLFFGTVCSQSLARDIALQLPRVINDFRYKIKFPLEDYHAIYGINLLSVSCTHDGKKRARDYKLTPEGRRRLMMTYYPSSPSKAMQSLGEVQLQPSKAIVEPQVQAHDPENCQIDDHYHEYIKDNRKFWRHVEEARQLSL